MSTLPNWYGNFAVVAALNTHESFVQPGGITVMFHAIWMVSQSAFAVLQDQSTVCSCLVDMLPLVIAVVVG